MLTRELGDIEGPKVVVIGGGTGNFTILTGLKRVVGEDLTAVVGMTDDGGSTGDLRDQYGVLPPGDVRQCLVALSNSSAAMRELFNFRFGPGSTPDERGLQGQNFGNLFLTAAEQLNGGGITQAIKFASEVLTLTGRVVPATKDNRRLVISTLDGQIIQGEHQAELTNIPSLRGATIGFDKNPTTINEEAAEAITQATEVVIAPGDLYTSIAPALAVQGMRDALVQTRANVIYVSNLMNRERHTVGFSVADYVDEIERIVGAPIVDYVLFNTDTPSKDVLKRYAGEGEFPVEAPGDSFNGKHYKAIGKPLLAKIMPEIDSNDALASTRSLIRHDPVRAGRAILAIHYGHGIV